MSTKVQGPVSKIVDTIHSAPAAEVEIQIGMQLGVPAQRPPSKRLSFRTILCMVLLVVAAILAWKQVKYKFIAKRLGVVTPGQVYRSGQISKWMLAPTLEKYDIQVVVDMTGRDKKDQHQIAEIATLNELQIPLHRFGMSGDGTGDIAKYAHAIEIIDRCVKEGKPVLVHCAAGAQRTGGVVSTYRMLVLKQPPEAAYAELSRYGWRAGEDQVLLDYVNAHMQELAELLVDKGVIQEVPQPLPELGP